jgi:hypothetical protein
MVQYHNFEQKSDEWFDFRKGKLTASNATAIGACGAGLKTYARNIAMELCGVEKKQISNSDIERGNEYEPLAITSYEFEFGVTVEQVGCITNDLYVDVCVSPDGLIGIEGGLEIKARNNEKHFALICGDESDIPFNQIQMSLFISEREWWDFASYNPNFQKHLFVKRIYPNLAYFEKLKKGFLEGQRLKNYFLETYNQFTLK